MQPNITINFTGAVLKSGDRVLITTTEPLDSELGKSVQDSLAEAFPGIEFAMMQQTQMAVQRRPDFEKESTDAKPA